MLANINQQEKTLVFCANQAHAALIRDLINQESPNKTTDYCVRVTANDGEIGDTYLKQFQDNDKTIPTIITTSQKLTTGVDALNVRFIVLMRPINSMIEFKQIIGRGTRLFEDKYFFTIIDFVDAYERFQDPDWDGPPSEPPLGPTPPHPPRGPKDPPTGDPGPENGNKRIKIKLSDGKERAIQAMQSTHFLLDGRVVSAQEFVQKLFDTLKLPEIFKNEDELRKLWSNPTTRKVLLQKLEDNGCTKSDLIQLQEMIEAEDSDLFDVLEYISYARQPISRSDRANQARRQVLRLLNDKQNEFVEFILSNYVKEGIDELDIDRLGISLNAKYQSTYQAKQELGDLESIKSVFIEFQQYLYKVA
jgi:type I restriction enzyme R subunit